MENKQSKKEMVGHMWNIFDFSRNQWLVSVIIGSCSATSLSATIPKLDEVYDQNSLINANSIIKKFDQFEHPVEMTVFSLCEGRKFLESFLAEINAKYGFDLTIPEACRLIQENIHILQISSELQDILLQTSRAIESSLENNVFQEIQTSNGLYWPTEWNWFGLNKKKHAKKSPKGNHDIVKSPSPMVEAELPSNCYVGAIELFTGALIFLLPFPGAQVAGVTVMGDGGRRIIDGIV